MNIMLILAVICVLFKIADGYKKGMVKEIVSLVTLIIMGIMIVLISKGLHSYMEKEERKLERSGERKKESVWPVK